MTPEERRACRIVERLLRKLDDAEVTFRRSAIGDKKRMVLVDHHMAPTLSAALELCIADQAAQRGRRPT